MKRKMIVIILMILTAGALTAQTMYVRSVDGLRMRDSGSFSGDSVCVIPYGEEVQVLSKPANWTNNWAHIRWNDRTGWVYYAFLSEGPLEDRSAIVVRQPTQDLIIGTWYVYAPFCPEEDKFTGDPYDNISTFSRYEFGMKGDYSEGHWEGGGSGDWWLNGSTLYTEGEAGYEESFPFEAAWDISLYQIRTDWLVMEALEWRTDNNGNRYLSVRYIIKPLSSRSERKIESYFADSM